MISGVYEQEIAAYLVFGWILNFLFSMLFGLYLTNNIGTEEMMRSRGTKPQPWWSTPVLLIPYAKMAVTLYRVAILQLFFLNRGHTHKEYWIYLTTEEH
jgi:hypothetical protein